MRKEKMMGVTHSKGANGRLKILALLASPFATMRGLSTARLIKSPLRPSGAPKARKSYSLAPFWRGTAIITAVVQLFAGPLQMMAAAAVETPAPAASSPPATSKAPVSASAATPAPVHVNKTVPTVKPLPVRDPLAFTFPVTDVQIIGAHLFEDFFIPIGGKTANEDNNALARALQKFGKNRWDLSPLEEFLASHPKSPWTAALSTNLGIIYRRTGYYSKALEAWKKAWSLTKSETRYPRTAVADRAVADLSRLLSSLGRTEELKPLLDSIKDRKMRGANATNVMHARTNLAVMLSQPGIAFKCGPFALGRIQKFLHPDQPLSPVVTKAQSSVKGFSLRQVQDLSNQMAMDYQMVKRKKDAALILPAVVHWKAGHYAAILKKERGRYLVQDPTFGTEMWMKEDAINSEASGYFLIPQGALAAGWTSVPTKEADEVWGRGVGVTKDGTQTKCPASASTGMARASILLMLACLHVADTPMVYAPSVGPMVDYTFEYNQYEMSQTGPVSWTSNVGNNWIAPLQSFVSSDAVIGDTVTLALRGGGSEVYTGYQGDATAGVYAPQVQGQATLHVMQSTDPNRLHSNRLYSTLNLLRYERWLPDGSKEIYDSEWDPVSTSIYLTQIIDPQGNSVNLTYQPVLLDMTPWLEAEAQVVQGFIFFLGAWYPIPVAGTGFQLAAVTDSLGQVTTFSYDLPDDPLKITAITDPFGRTARFSYTEAVIPPGVGISTDPQSPNSPSIPGDQLPGFVPRQLASITDVVGIVSKFNYAPGTDVMTSMTTPYGTTTFNAWQDGNADTELVITDPNGGQERALSRHADADFVPDEARPNVPYANAQAEAGDAWHSLAAANTYYWDKKAMMDAPGDLSKAHIYHWLFMTESGSVSGVPYCEKSALESRVWYNYDRPAGADPSILGTSSLPTGVARVLDDGSTQATQTSYNGLGMPTQTIDPLGRQVNYAYADNNYDLTLVQGANGDVLEQIAYDPAYPAHRPKTITDASGRVTSFTYNSAGQVLTITNAKSETTTFTYDAGHNLINITGPVAGATMAFTYDGFGRVRTVTDSEGYTLTQDYDALNRPTVTTYPDGSYEQNIYNVLDVGWRKDRLDRWTTFSHNSVRNLTAVEDPLGRTTRYGYCVCGALVSLTDPAGNTTGWDRDLEERPEAKIFADGTKQLYAYDLAGRLASLTDAKGQVTNYTYNIDNTLKQKVYAHAQNPTAPVSFAYDPNYQRVVAMTDGTGTNNYTYNSYSTAQPPATTTGAGRLATASGPLANAVIAYGYDELGRVNATSIDGANNSTTQTYDSLGRITGITNPLGAFTYSYLNATKRLSSITYPNSQVTNFSYFGNTGDQRLQEISNLTPAGATVSKFDYTFNSVGNILSWQQQTDANTPGIYNYQYDAADQLTSATFTNTISHADLHHYGYGYDSAGNRTGEQIDSQVNSATPNKLNQLTATQGGGPLQFSGTLDQPATVTVGGNPATVSGNTFTGYANVTPGNNQVVVSATSASGQTTNHTFQVTATGGAPQDFKYDPDGNTLSDGTKTYEWDAQNRLTAINYLSTQNRSEFKYDGLDRRVAITEKTNGTVTGTKNFAWVGATVAEERDANDSVTKRFYAQGEQIGGTAYYFTWDHLGSVREMTDATGAMRARYDYDPYGTAAKMAGDLSADIQFAGYYTHEPSKLNLTFYRAYNSSVGRWLSRDPIAENEGVNMYEYGGNNPVDEIDPFGLAGGPPSWWPTPPSNIPGGPWTYYPNPNNSRGGEYRGPSDGTPGGRSNLTFGNSPKNPGGYWKCTRGGQPAQRYDLSGNPQTSDEAHFGSPSTPPPTPPPGSDDDSPSWLDQILNGIGNFFKRIPVPIPPMMNPFFGDPNYDPNFAPRRPMAMMEQQSDRYNQREYDELLSTKCSLRNRS